MLPDIPGRVKGFHDQPETVRYRLLPAMLLNELQKQHRMIDELQSRIEQLERFLL
jgi:hypothetical protein